MLNGEWMLYFAGIFIESQGEKLSFLDQHVIGLLVIGWSYNLPDWLSFQRRIKVTYFHLVHICLFELVSSNFNTNVGFQSHLKRFPVIFIPCLIEVCNRTIDFHNELHCLAESHLSQFVVLNRQSFSLIDQKNTCILSFKIIGPQ